MRTRNRDELRLDFEQLRQPDRGKKRIKSALKKQESNLAAYLAPWYEQSKENSHVYPSQGLLVTPYDYLNYQSLQLLPQETIVKTLRLRRFFLELFNHPYRTSYLQQVSRQKFTAPSAVANKAIEFAQKAGMSLAVGDLGAVVIGASKARISRTDRFAQGPFVKLGRQGRHIFVGSSSPDVWNSAAAIATMAASQCLAGIPRNGVLSDISRQAEVAKETFVWLKRLAKEILPNRSDATWIKRAWRNNVMGTVEAAPEKAVERASALYEVGVRCFRVYSPEPGTGPGETVVALRKKFGQSVEIFAGQVVEVEQAQKLEAAGADGLFVGIGGGGRCITGIRSGSAIDWPELVWRLRGQIKIPVIAEGGASDHIAVSLLLGASGISVSRVVAGGTIESPGGALFCADAHGHLFKPYGGEASARTKYLDGKLLPFDIPAFVEGETTEARMTYVKFVYPTLTYNLHLLIEDAILALVFRGANDTRQLQALNPSPLRWITSSGNFAMNTH